MSIFDLHSHVLADYRDFVRSFFIVADARARQFVEHALVEEARLGRISCCRSALPTPVPPP